MKKTKSYYTVVLIIIGITIFSGILLRQIYIKIKTETINNYKNQIKATIEASDKSIQFFLGGIINDLNYLSNIRHVGKFSKQGETILDNFIKIHSETNSSKYIYAITRIDTTGKIIYSTPTKNAIGKIVANQEHNAWALKHRKVILSNVFMTVQGVMAIAITHPVFYKGKFTGLLSVLVPFDYFSRNFLQVIKFGKETQTYLIEQNGTILFSTDYDDIGESVHEVPDCYKCEDVIDKIIDKRNSFISFQYKLDQTKTEKGYLYVREIKLPHNKWKVIVFVPEHEFLASIESLSKNFVAVGIFLLLTVIIAFVSHNVREKAQTKKFIERERIFKLVSEKTGQITFECDLRKGQLRFFGNYEDVLGYSKDEFLSFSWKNFLKLVHPNDRHYVITELRSAIKDRKTHFSLDFRIKHKRGKYLYVNAETALLTNKKGRPYKMVGSIKDITLKKVQEEELKRYKDRLEELVQERTKTLEELLIQLREEIEERKKKEKQLEIAKQKVEAANRLKSEFLAQMSHEIRTPVNVIISYTSLLQVELEEKIEPELQETFHAISTAGDRIIRTVELILNMTDLQTGSFEPHFKMWDVYDQILRRVFFEYLPKAREKNIALILSEPEGDMRASVDEFSVRQIFANIIDNAIKYTDEGKVQIDMYRNEDDKLVVEISDTGIGINEEYIPHLFDTFSQEQQGYTRKFEGNGLGLALVKQYCDLNNIEIKVESEKGKGTKFILIFNNSDVK